MRTTVFERSKPSSSVVKHSLQGSRHATFWLEDVGRPVEYPALDGDLSADIAVVGGGYCGLWTALLAKQANPDARVVLLEAKTIGWAASGRNGGFCEASLTHGEENGQARWPKEMDRLNELGLENLDAVERTIADLGIDCDFERNGAIDLAVEPYQAEALRSAELAADSLFLDSDAIAAEVKSPTYLAGIWHKRTSALVHPAKLAVGLAEAAVDLGVEIFEESKVDAINSSRSTPDAPVDVVTGRGTVRAKRVALATNVFPSLLKRNSLHTVPVYDYALMTEPLTASQLESIGWHHRQGLGDAANQFHYYRLSADNRILFGGYDAIYHYGRRVDPRYEDRPDTYARLASHFFTTFPQLEGLKFTNHWAGAIDTSTRFCAFFGQARQGRVAYATGFTGLGVASTHFAAEVMNDMMRGEKTERTELQMVKQKAIPFPPEPLAYLGIQATRMSLDQADHNYGKRNLILKTLDALGLGFDS